MFSISCLTDTAHFTPTVDLETKRLTDLKTRFKVDILEKFHVPFLNGSHFLRKCSVKLRRPSRTSTFNLFLKKFWVRESPLDHASKKHASHSGRSDFFSYYYFSMKLGKISSINISFRRQKFCVIYIYTFI